MQGLAFFACSNISRTREAPTPTNISTKSEPEMVKNGTPASPAMALANNVLPVPGGPTSKAPFGILPPKRSNFNGDFKNSTISWSSCLASSIPATSANVTFFLPPSNLALDFPKLIAFPLLAVIWRIMKIQIPINKIIGSHANNVIPHPSPSFSGAIADNATLCSCNNATKPASSGA